MRVPGSAKSVTGNAIQTVPDNVPPAKTSAKLSKAFGVTPQPKDPSRVSDLQEADR